MNEDSQNNHYRELTFAIGEDFNLKDLRQEFQYQSEPHIFQNEK